MKHIETKHYERISKAAAKKLFDKGAVFYMVPCNVSPDNNIMYPARIEKEPGYNDDFEKIVAAYTVYNCNYKEYGKYPAFYTKKQGFSFWQIYECRDPFGGLYASVITEIFTTEKPCDRDKILSGYHDNYHEYYRHFDTENAAREYLHKIRTEG